MTQRKKNQRTDHFEFGGVARTACSVFTVARVDTSVASTNAIDGQNAGAFAQFRYTYIHVRSDRLIVKRPK